MYTAFMSDSVLSSSAARKLSKLGAAKGGRARANVLTAEERREIGRKAVQVRWAKARLSDSMAEGIGELMEKGQAPDAVEQVLKSADLDSKVLRKLESIPKLPIALFPGKLPMANVELSCYVLDNGKRVMAQREVVRLFTGHVKGNLSRYLEAQYLQPYLPSGSIIDQAIHFRIPGVPNIASGYEATLLLDICDGYLRAREDNVLDAPAQINLAKQAEIITRACAKVGIIALIDEATGYQQFRKKQELQLKLQAFIAEDMQEWARMFQDEFWFELARLESVHYSARSRPLRWGKYIMAFVYDAIDGDVSKELRKKNPDPHFKQNHHHWLKEFGRQKVHDQIERVITIMKLCDSMDDFRAKFTKVFKKTAISHQLNFDWGSDA
jgi:hypothetical protein